MRPVSFSQKLINRFGKNKIQNIKAIVYDRDATINIPHPGIAGTKNTGYVTTPEEFKLMPNAGEGLQKAFQAGYQLHIFTQQKGIGKNLINEQDLHRIHRHMRKILQQKFQTSLGSVVFCPHIKIKINDTLDYPCDCVKPRPGLLLDILKHHNLNADEVLVIGDSDRDIPHHTLQEQGMIFVAVPNPEASVKKGKLNKKSWEKAPFNQLCANDLLEISTAMSEIKKE